MSTFTEFNGPQQGMPGPTLSQLTALIEAYNKLSVQLQTHVEKSVSQVTDVHNVKTYVDSVKDAITATYTAYINNIINGINDQISIINSALDNRVSTLTFESAISTINSHIADLQTLCNTFAVEDDVQDKLDRITATVEAVRHDLTSFTQMFDTLEDDELGLDEDLRVDGKVTAQLNVLNKVDFTSWAEFQAPYAGTGGLEAGTQGVYVLGCLSENWDDDPNAPISNKYKPARIYVKYFNSEPFDAIIDVAVVQRDNTFAGSLTAKVAKVSGTWKDMAFHIVHGTGTQGQDTVDKMYLCISAKGLAVSNENGTYSVTQATFKVAGENFCAVGQEGYVRPNGMLHNITTVKIGTEAASITAIDKFSANSFAVYAESLNTLYDLAGNKIFDIQTLDVPEGTEVVTHRYMFIGNNNYDKVMFTTRPYLVTDDGQGNVQESKLITAKEAINVTVPIGGMIKWLGQTPPEGYLLCDGSQVLASEYPELANVLGSTGLYVTLPNETYAIIRANYGDLQDATEPVEEFMSFDILNTRINEETTRAQGAETQLSTAIEAEQTRAEAAEGAIADDLDAETARAEAAEQAIATDVTALGTRTTATEQAITAETARAEAAEQDIEDKADSAQDTADTNTTAIQNEIARATAAEQALNTRISAYHPGA